MGRMMRTASSSRLRSTATLGLLLVLLSKAYGAYAQARLPIDREIAALAELPSGQKALSVPHIAASINHYPSDTTRLQLALGLVNAAEYGSVDRTSLQLAADTLASALATAPQPADLTDGSSPPYYTSLASTIRYEHLHPPLDPRLQPMLRRAETTLEANDAAVQRADFTLKDTAGRDWTLSKLKGHVVLVDFWATWCAPCVAEMPDLESLYHRYAAQGLIVFSLSGEDPTVVRSFLAKRHFTLPVLLDPNHDVMGRFHVPSIPRNFLYDRDGVLVRQFSVRSESQVVEFLTEAGLKP